MVHELKLNTKYYEPVATGQKRFEVRKNDRGFKTGDILELREYDNTGCYTGREVTAEVDYILDEPEFVKEGYVIMSIRPLTLHFKPINEGLKVYG